MLFNSIDFFCFFIIVLLLYSLLGLRSQNRLLLIASYFFYGAWDWRFLFLIFVSTGVCYGCGLFIERSKTILWRRRWLLTAVFSNLAILGFFKYCGFFVGQLTSLLGSLGLPFHTGTLSIILPIGISFYTFQSLSYVIDVYRRDFSAVKKFGHFALFVSFFPQLVAGPIVRARDLMPQIEKVRQLRWEGLRIGAYLFFWGLFKKCVVADNLAPFVDSIYGNYASSNAAQVWTATVAFALQIYGDFSGYSDMAVGLASCLGFRLKNNFDHPYFSTSVQEFWHRWHITLSQWMRDYVYIPLGGNRLGTFLTHRNILITMGLGGLWHGASWTFVFWGLYQGALLSIHRLLKPTLSRIRPGSKIGRGIWGGLCLLVTFHAVCLGWILFRAPSMDAVVTIFVNALRGVSIAYAPNPAWTKILVICAALVGLEWWTYCKGDALAHLRTPIFVRWLNFSVVALLLVLFGAPLGGPFIYFQF
jgi:alginate O-acetyltransferase complex protein AlgI